MDIKVNTSNMPLDEAIEEIAEQVAAYFEERVSDEKHKRWFKRLVFEISDRLNLDDPFDAADELDEEKDHFEATLRNVRKAIKQNDIEYAELLIHRETGDY